MEPSFQGGLAEGPLACEEACPGIEPWFWPFPLEPGETLVVGRVLLLVLRARVCRIPTVGARLPKGPVGRSL